MRYGKIAIATPDRLTKYIDDTDLNRIGALLARVIPMGMILCNNLQPFHPLNHFASSSSYIARIVQIAADETSA